MRIGTIDTFVNGGHSPRLEILHDRVLNTKPGICLELLKICSWWCGKTTLVKGRTLIAPQLGEIHEAGIIRAEGNRIFGVAHIALKAEALLQHGLGYYLCRVRRPHQGSYRSIDIGLTALQAFIRRYVCLAAELASTPTTDTGTAPGATRRAEFTLIEENCRAIADSPPATFHQALQIESNGHSVSLRRMNQYLYSFYRAGRDAGRITADTAMKLLENTWVNLFSVNKIRSCSHTRYSAGSPLYQNVTISGQTRHDQDALNQPSFLILRSVGETKLTQPNLSVWFRKGFGMSAFNNDEIVIPSFIDVAVLGKRGYRHIGKHFINFMAHNNTVLIAVHPFRPSKTTYQKTLAINGWYDLGNIQMRGKVQPQNLARRNFDFWLMSEDRLQQQAASRKPPDPNPQQYGRAPPADLPVSKRPLAVGLLDDPGTTSGAADDPAPGRNDPLRQRSPPCGWGAPGRSLGRSQQQ